MKKSVIFSIHNVQKGTLDFYFKKGKQIYHLYYIRYRKNAHEFFRYGKSISELHRRTKWKKSPLLRHVIEGPLLKKAKKIIKEDLNAR